MRGNSWQGYDASRVPAKTKWLEKLEIRQCGASFDPTWVCDLQPNGKEAWPLSGFHAYPLAEAELPLSSAVSFSPPLRATSVLAQQA